MNTQSVMENRAAVMIAHIPSKPTLNMAEATAALDCSDNHVRHLIEEGSLIAANVACKGCRPNWRVSRESVIQFLKGRVQ